MMTAREERSIGSGIPFPSWVKNKRNCSRFDFDQSTFSPTELDDSFMLHYLHPVASSATSSTSHIIRSKSPSPGTKSGGGTFPVTAKDISKHPPACQKYLVGDVSPQAQTTPQMKIKSSGVDDGFKGEAAKCGSSIVRVASQIVSGKVIGGFAEQESSSSCDQPPSVNYMRRRRNSKSLPASPLTSPHGSPKSIRKTTHRYFTAAFTDTDKSTGSWILSNLLARRNISQSVGHIGEETGEELERASSTMSVDDPAAASASSKSSAVFKAKPSELREMNFWSPTSM